MGDNPTTTTATPPLTSTPTESITPNTQHIHEKAFYRGYRDFTHGRLDCPYHKHSLVAKEWQRGQNAAYFRNLKKLRNGSLMREYYKKKSTARTLKVPA